MTIYTVTLHDYDRAEVVGTFSGIEGACAYLGATAEDLESEGHDGTISKRWVFGYKSYTITMTFLDDLVPPDNTGCCDANESDEITEDCFESFFQRAID